MQWLELSSPALARGVDPTLQRLRTVEQRWDVIPAAMLAGSRGWAGAPPDGVEKTVISSSPGAGGQGGGGGERVGLPRPDPMTSGH